MPPFSGKNTSAVISNIKKAKFNLKSPSFDDISAEAKDLLRRLLKKDPKKRISAQLALTHPWFSL